MSLAAKLRRAPGRIATGAFILNAGIGKLKADEGTANALHGMASGAYPFLGKIAPKTFLRGVAIAETTLGSALLLPIVPAKVAGAGLTGFSAGLLGMWWRTPGMHEGLRPTQAGTTISKDVWMLGIGTSLVIDGVLGDAGDSRSVRRANRQVAKAERKASKAERKASMAERKASMAERKAEQNDYRVAAIERRRELRDEAKASAKEHAKDIRAAAKSAAREQAESARKTAHNVADAARPVAESALASARDLAESAASATRSAAESAASTASDSVRNTTAKFSA